MREEKVTANWFLTFYTAVLGGLQFSTLWYDRANIGNLDALGYVGLVAAICIGVTVFRRLGASIVVSALSFSTVGILVAVVNANIVTVVCAVVTVLSAGYNLYKEVL